MKLVSRALLSGGTILLAVFIGAHVHRLVGANVALAQFASPAPDSTHTASVEPDTSLWSESRIRAFRDSLGLTFDPPLAVLRIPRASMEAPVLRGTDEASLNRGLGWVEGTTLPGQPGNVAVAGHRDGFFRVLKDVVEGDVIVLETAAGAVDYLVTSTRIIEPENVEVLGPTEDPRLTLVTCYPFYFVGAAPQRFIVTAVPRGDTGAAAGPTNQQQLDPSITDHPSGMDACQRKSNKQQVHGGVSQ